MSSVLYLYVVTVYLATRLCASSVRTAVHAASHRTVLFASHFENDFVLGTPQLIFVSALFAHVNRQQSTLNTAWCGDRGPARTTGRQSCVRRRGLGSTQSEAPAQCQTPARCFLPVLRQVSVSSHHSRRRTTAVPPRPGRISQRYMWRCGTDVSLLA